MNWEGYIEAASAVMDLPVPEEHRDGVALFLELAAEMAATLDRVELDDAELVLAPVYRLPDSEGTADG